MSPEKAKKIADKIRMLLESEPAMSDDFSGQIELPIHCGGISGAIKIIKLCRETNGKEM